MHPTLRIILFLIIGNFSSLASFSQPDSLKQAPIDDIVWDTLKWDPSRRSARVIISSEKNVSAPSNTWEGKWADYVERSALSIAEKQMKRDSTRITFRVMIEFSVNEDESLRDLKITCTPANRFIEKECYKMVLNAPKRKPVYNNGKYVRAHVKQPIDIKIKR